MTAIDLTVFGVSFIVILSSILCFVYHVTESVVCNKYRTRILRAINEIGDTVRPITKTKLAALRCAPLITFKVNNRRAISSTGKIHYTPDIDSWCGCCHLFAVIDDRISFISPDTDEHRAYSFYQEQ